MTQILVHGKKGSGKTLYCVKNAYEAYKEGRTVYSNIRLKFSHIPLTKDMIESIMKQDSLQHCFILIDELHTIADSRRSMTKNNINWGYFFTQSRKRGVDIMATTQFPGQVDLRFRNNCDYVIEINKILISRQLRDVRFIVAATWRNTIGQCINTKFMRNPEEYYKLYDTNEIVYYDWQAQPKGDK